MTRTATSYDASCGSLRKGVTMGYYHGTMPVMENVLTSDLSKIELVEDAAAEVGESPVWDASLRRLWWIDLFRGELHGFDVEHGPIEPILIGQSLGFVALTGCGALLAGTQEGFGLLGKDFDLKVPVERDAPDRRMSDGKCDLHGRAWGGTMHDAERADGRLYRLDSGWRLSLVREDLKVPNGLAWSGDGERMYITDSEDSTVNVWRYDQEQGVPTERLQTISIEQGAGLPDGITVDEDDCVWIALWGGGVVRRYSPEGELMLQISLPCTLVTSVAFGGDDLGDLYITTARYRLSPEKLASEPHAGGIFRYRPGVRGRLASPYVC